jgi:hypothetical protein
MKEVWIDLKHFCKRYGRKDKTRKEKGKKIRKGKRATGILFGPGPKASHGPLSPNPEGVFLFPFPRH